MLMEIFASADQRELQAINPSAFEDASPYRRRGVMRKRETKAYNKKAIVQMLSTGHRASQNGYKLTDK